MKTMHQLSTFLLVCSAIFLLAPAARSQQPPWYAVDEDQAICLIGSPPDLDGDGAADNNATTGDDWYQSWWRGNQPWVDWLWSHYDFDPADWDNGFGYESVDNCNMPLCRTLNGLMALYGSDPVPITRTDDYSGSILHWGANFADANIDELDARCPHGRPSASTQIPWLNTFGDAWTQLYPNFFWGKWAAERAGTLVHEARHGSGAPHNAYDWECGQGGSCDTNWEFNGANTYEILWNWWYWYQATNAPPGGKKRAKFAGNYDLANSFRDRPPYIITCGNDEEPC
jgi:hypothetical protein